MKDSREERIKALMALSDAEVERAAKDDPDCPPITPEKAAQFIRVADMPGKSIQERFQNAMAMAKKQAISLRCDSDVLAYYRAKGKGYQTIMNAVLRAYMEVEKASEKVLAEENNDLDLVSPASARDRSGRVTAQAN